MNLPFLHSRLLSVGAAGNYLEAAALAAGAAAGALAAALSDAAFAFFAFFAFFGFLAGASPDAAVEAAAGAEAAGAEAWPAANAETENKPATKAAINLFMVNP